MIETWNINSNSMINSIEHQLNNVWFLLYRQNWTRYRTRAKSSGSMGQFNGGKKRSVSSCSRIRYPWCPCWLESSCRHGTTYSCSVSWSQRCVQLYYLIHIIFHIISLTIFKYSQPMISQRINQGKKSPSPGWILYYQKSMVTSFTICL